MVTEIQKVELEMAKYFKDFCADNDLTYFLDSGTLLGAVRHQGFIPWDDDMDLTLFRSDFEKLKTLSKKFENSKYKLLFIENTADYFYPYIKMVDKRTKVIEDGKRKIEELGIFIDIFPIDFVPKNKIVNKIFFTGVSFFRRLFFVFMSEKSQSTNVLKRMAVKVFASSGTRNWAKLFNKYSIIFNNSKNTDSCSHILGNLKNCEVPKAYFEKSVELPFEDTSFTAPVEYDLYLKDSFGDYWQLPPESEQKTHKLNVQKR